MNRAYLAAKVAHDHYILARCHWNYGQDLQDHLVESYNSGPLAAMLIAPGGMSSISEDRKIPTGKLNSKGFFVTQKVKAPGYYYSPHDDNGCLHFKSLRGVRNFLKTAEHYTSHLWDGEGWIMQPAP
jgi:hypothetical protein